MTTKRENGIGLFQELVAGENSQDYDRMYSVYAPEMAIYLNGEVFYAGKPEVIRDWEKQHTPTIYGDSHRDVQWIDATDNRVTAQYTVAFDHNGEVFGLPATGNRVEFHGVAIAEHDGEKVQVLRLFADQGEMNRQLSGEVREPGTASAARVAPPVPENERARYEVVGERLIRTAYDAENERDIEKQLACYADPLLDHFAGRAKALPLSVARDALPAWWASLPGLHRDIEEVLALGDRAVLRWHLTAEPLHGQPVSQHGCSVIEHDGERIRKFWTYYADVAALYPAIRELD